MGVEGVILAAGLSSRAGTHKMVLKIGERTIIENCVQGMYDVCSRIIVVGGYKIENIMSALKGYSKVEIIFNKNYMDGMFSSVKEGIRYVQEDKFFLIPGDYPMVGKGVYYNMLQCNGDIVVPTYNGKRGHPILINSRHISSILNNCKYSNLKEYIEPNKVVLTEVEEPGILIDVDTMEDFHGIVKSEKFKY